MSMLVKTLRDRVRYMEQEVETLAQAMDGISAAYAAALDKLQPYEPGFVAQAYAAAGIAPAPEAETIGSEGAARAAENLSAS